MSFENRLSERIREYQTQEQNLSDQKERQWPNLKEEMKSWWSDMKPQLSGLPIIEEDEAQSYKLIYKDQHIGSCSLRIELLVNGNICLSVNGKKQSPLPIASMNQANYQDLVLEFLDLIIDLRQRPSQDA